MHPPISKSIIEADAALSHSKIDQVLSSLGTKFNTAFGKKSFFFYIFGETTS
jgi:hypothetical protein